MGKLYSLRGHSNPITSIQQIKFSNDSHSSIISGDNQGWLIWWDFSISRRPIGIWHGHPDNPIITIKQIDHDMVLTHGKDSLIKLWENLSQFKKNFNKKVGDNINEYPIPKFIEIPVNCLNFCNVDYFNNFLLVPSTMDSDNFEIYSLFKDDQFELVRHFKNISPLKLLHKQQGIDFEIPLNHSDNPQDATRGKFGIMMKSIIIDRETFFIGYESGHIIGFKISWNNNSIINEKLDTDKTIIFKSPSIDIIHHDDSHVPNPITSLDYNLRTNKLFTGSASKKIIIYDLSNNFVSTTLKTNHFGSQIISTNDNFIIIEFWDGVFKCYDWNLNELYKYKRNFERIEKIDNNENDEIKKNHYKINTLKLLQNSGNKVDALTKSNYKQLIKSKRLNVDDLLFVGYNDGLIDAFDNKV